MLHAVCAFICFKMDLIRDLVEDKYSYKFSVCFCCAMKRIFEVEKYHDAVKPLLRADVMFTCE